MPCSESDQTLSRRRSAALATLRRVTREITSTLDLDYLLDFILDEAVHFTVSEAGLILLFSNDDARLQVTHGCDEAALATLEDRWDDWVTWLTVHLDAESVVYIPDTSISAEGPPGFPAEGALLATPIRYEQHLAAALLLQGQRPKAFDDVDLELVAGLGDQTVIALSNARRYQEQLRRGELMRQRAEQMSLLLEISRTTRSDRPLDDILLDVAYAVQEGTGFELVLISVLEGGLLRRVAGAGIPLAELERRKETRLPWERVRRLCQARFQLGQCYYIPEAHRSLTEDLDVFVPEAVEPEGVAPTDRWQTEDIFFVPLRNNAGDVIGIMSLDRPREMLAPTTMTAEVVELFASQVAQAIETHRLVEDLRRQVTTLQLFNELNRSITAKLDLPLVLNTVVQSVTNLLGYDFATLFLSDSGERNFVPMASSGYALDLIQDMPMGVKDALPRDLIRTGLPLVVEDVGGDPRFAGARIPIGSSIAVPLSVEGRTVGILMADRKASGDFSPAEVATLSALADQVTVAIENARLFDQVRRFNEELEARVAARTQELADALERLRFQRDRSEVLYHIASELVASLDIDRVLSQALMLLQRAVQASRSSVILLESITGQLLYRATIGHTSPIPPGGKPTPFGRGEGVVGWVLEKRKAVTIDDILDQDRFETDRMEGTRSLLVVPILGSAGEALGVILLQSPFVDAFDATHLQLVEAAAVQLGNALNNAELYRLIREQAERLGTMLRMQQIDAAKNEAILEGIADGVMVADARGRVILFNAAAERILSLSKEQALGRSQDEVFGLYGSETQEWLSQIACWRENAGNYDAQEFLSHRLEVDRCFVSIHLSPVVTGAGEFLGVVSVFRDITAEIEADQAKSDFVSTVSHELRTPMTSIVGYVDLVIQGAAGPLSEMQQGFLDKVKTNADRLTNLVDDLLDISRIEQGRIELMRQPLDMALVVSQVMDLVMPRIVEKCQVITAVLPSDLPKAYGDADRVAQILTNLVSNAYKYTPVAGNITIYAYVREAMLHIAVADTGIGVASENQKKIFERFYRVEDDPAVYEVSGTGLGLAIALSLIQMHGGNIWLESELGTGSTFTFSIPLADGELTEDLGERPPPLLARSMPTVLVVEDDPDIRNLLRLTLETEGMRALTAASGEEALRTARQKLPDFISLDVRLPDLDGFEVLQLLRREPETADIPVVMVSVIADRDRGMALGAVDYLTKPLDERKLLEVIRCTLRQRQIVIVVDSDRQTLNRLRSALQIEGIAVRTTIRGERALRLAQDLRPRLMVVSPKLIDMDGYQFVDRLRRDPRTSHIPLLLTVNADEEPDKYDPRLRDFEGVRFVTKLTSVEALATDICVLITGDDSEEEAVAKRNCAKQ